MKPHRLHNKKFVTTGNMHGLSSSETVFHYAQQEDVITGTYAGGLIAHGFLVGKQTGPDEIELLFHCLTSTKSLEAGQSRGKITEDGNGHLLLIFSWNWLTGDQSGGFSSYIEVEKPLLPNNGQQISQKCLRVVRKSQ